MAAENDDLNVTIDKTQTNPRDFLDSDDKEDKQEDKPEPKDDKEDEPDEDDTDLDSESDTEDDDEEQEDDDLDIDDEESEEDTSQLEEEEQGLPSFKAIKTKYPKLFKDFPQLGEVYRDYKRIIQVAPTIESIKEYKEKSETLDFLSNSIVKGDVNVFLKATKEQGALIPFAKKVLPSLREIDKEAFEQAVDPLLKDLIRKWRAFGERSKDNNTVNASKLLTQFLYSDLDLPPDKEEKEDPEYKKKLDELTAKERAIEAREQHRFISQLETNTRKRMMAIIEDRLPKGPNDEQLSEFVQDALTKKIMDRYSEIMNKDAQHMSIARKLMAEAKRLGFPDNSRVKLTNQYLSKAKFLLPKLTAKYLAELSKRREFKKSKTEEENTPINKSSTKAKDKKEDARPLRERMSPREFLDKES